MNYFEYNTMRTAGPQQPMSVMRALELEELIRGAIKARRHGVQFKEIDMSMSSGAATPTRPDMPIEGRSRETWENFYAAELSEYHRGITAKEVDSEEWNAFVKLQFDHQTFVDSESLRLAHGK